jgi:pimeloyl-ACP methyl ester carboxylesterase
MYMAIMKHHILYIPGLGSGYDRYRKYALRVWSLFGVDVQLLPMNWYDGQPYECKFNQASDLIRQLLKAGKRVTLVGESAGGSMAINLFAAHPEVARLITVAGVNKASTPIMSKTLRRGPAFAASRQQLAGALPKISDRRRRNIHTLSGLIDNVVASPFSTIPGTNHRRVWSIGHVSTIALCLTLLCGYIVFLAKKPTSV